MWNASEQAERFYGARRQSAKLAKYLPELVALNVGEGIVILDNLTDECGVLFDEQAIFGQALEIVAHEAYFDEELQLYKLSHRSHAVSDQPRLLYSSNDIGGLERCAEVQAYLRSFEKLTQLLLWQLKNAKLYRDGQLLYALDHMRSNKMVLRRTDLIHDLIRAEVA